MGICFKLRYKLPDWCLRNIYFAFVHPYILYGLEVYGNKFVSDFNKLTKLNNKFCMLYRKSHIITVMNAYTLSIIPFHPNSCSIIRSCD